MVLLAPTASLGAELFVHKFKADTQMPDPMHFATEKKKPFVLVLF